MFRSHLAPALALLVVASLLAGCGGPGGEGGDREPVPLKLRLDEAEDHLWVEAADGDADWSNVSVTVSFDAGFGVNHAASSYSFENGAFVSRVRNVTAGVATDAFQGQSFPLLKDDFLAICVEADPGAPLQVTVRDSSQGDRLVFQGSLQSVRLCPVAPRVSFGWVEDSDFFFPAELSKPPSPYWNRLALKVSGNDGPIHYVLNGTPTAQSPVVAGGAVTSQPVPLFPDNFNEVHLCAAGVEQGVTVEVIDRRTNQVLVNKEFPQRFTFETINLCL